MTKENNIKVDKTIADIKKEFSEPVSITMIYKKNNNTLEETFSSKNAQDLAAEMDRFMEMNDINPLDLIGVK